MMMYQKASLDCIDVPGDLSLRCSVRRQGPFLICIFVQAKCTVVCYFISSWNIVIYFIEQNIPTTSVVKFQLHTVARSWNEASSVCQSTGGKLLRVDGVSKKHALQYFIGNWMAHMYVT